MTSSDTKRDIYPFDDACLCEKWEISNWRISHYKMAKLSCGYYGRSQIFER